MAISVSSTSWPVICLTSALVAKGAVAGWASVRLGWTRMWMASSDGKVCEPPGHATVNAARYEPATSLSPSVQGYCTTPDVRGETNSAVEASTGNVDEPSIAIENVTLVAVVRSIGAPVASVSDVYTAGSVSPALRNRSTAAIYF